MLVNFDVDFRLPCSHYYPTIRESSIRSKQLQNANSYRLSQRFRPVRSRAALTVKYLVALGVFLTPFQKQVDTFKSTLLRPQAILGKTTLEQSLKKFARLVCFFMPIPGQQFVTLGAATIINPQPLSLFALNP